MTLTNWIILSTFTFAQIIAIITIYVNAQVKQKEQDMNIQSLQREIIEHKGVNEKAERRMDEHLGKIYSSINEVKQLVLDFYKRGEA